MFFVRCVMIYVCWSNGRTKMQMDIMTISQTASYLQVCEKTIRRLIEKKELTASKVGGSWRIKKTDVDDYLENNKNSN